VCSISGHSGDFPRPYLSGRHLPSLSYGRKDSLNLSGQNFAGKDLMKVKEGDAYNFIAKARGSETMRRNCEEGWRVRDRPTYEHRI